MNTSVGILIIFALIIFLINFPVGIIADKRGRSCIGWILFSIFFSPVIGLILVLCLGETDSHRMERIRKEEEMRELERIRLNSKHNEFNNNSNQLINDLYKRK